MDLSIQNPSPVSMLERSENPPSAKKITLPPDPFDPARLRLSGDFTAAAGVKKLLTSVPVRRPSKEWFVRCHPDAMYRLETCVIEMKEDSETYLIDPSLWPSLSGESTFGPRLLVTAQNKQGVLFLWPVKMPRPDGRQDRWNQSALEAIGLASKTWVRFQANMSLGAYEVFQATGELADADWSTVPSFSDLLRIAFKDRFVTTADHPILRRLRGEV